MTGAGRVVTAADDPELVDRAHALVGAVWPEYNLHGDVLNAYWGRLYAERAPYQFAYLDGGEVVGRAHSLPVAWDRTMEDLPEGIDGAMRRGFDGPGATVLCALSIEVTRRRQGTGLSSAILRGMAGIAREHGFEALIAPVRPSWKERYPLTPIERYAGWRREDGLLLDPWLRVHERLGAEVLKPEPRSLRVTGTVSEWEEWTGLVFPESGDYVIPQGLATLAVDVEGDRGAYWEPNVWMRHPVSKG